MTTRKKFDLPKVAIVLWKDACGYDTRGYDPDDLEVKEKRSVMVLSVGMVIHDDQEGVTLASSTNTPHPDDKKSSIDYPMCIPKEYIKMKKYLK